MQDSFLHGSSERTLLFQRLRTRVLSRNQPKTLALGCTSMENLWERNEQAQGSNSDKRAEIVGCINRKNIN